jgi:hypothetical protein
MFAEFTTLEELWSRAWRISWMDIIHGYTVKATWNEDTAHTWASLWGYLCLPIRLTAQRHETRNGYL